MGNPTLIGKYRKALTKLFPRGKAWESLESPDTNLYKLLESYSTEICRIDDRAKALIEEVDPRTTVELLTDWERLLGLPDECDNVVDPTQQERRNRVLQVLTTRGGQNEQFYKDMASNFGIDAELISAEDQPPFTAGSRAGDRLTNGLWRYAFTVVSPADFLIKFRAGQGSAGDPLVKVGNDTLQCLIEKHKPAHTIALFSFGE